MLANVGKFAFINEPLFQEIFNDTKITITGLNAVTTYRFQVFAENGVSLPGKSEYVDITVTTEASVPSLVSNVRITSVKSSELSISWNAPIGDVSSDSDLVEIYEGVISALVIPTSRFCEMTCTMQCDCATCMRQSDYVTCVVQCLVYNLTMLHYKIWMMSYVWCNVSFFNLFFDFLERHVWSKVTMQHIYCNVHYRIWRCYTIQYTYLQHVWCKCKLWLTSFYINVKSYRIKIQHLWW